MLTCDLHYLALGVPGNALPTDLLTSCGLPTVDDMVFDSQHGERLFKDARDHTFTGASPGALSWSSRCMHTPALAYRNG